MMQRTQRIFFSAIAAVIFLCLCPVGAQASVVLRIRGINPSKTQAQKVAVKVYLPKEVEPEHVLSKDDLDLVYDAQEGQYYVYQEYDIDAGGAVEREVEMKDIWFIPQDMLDNVRSDAARFTQYLENTIFAERAKVLFERITSKLDEIEASQKISEVNPEKHISKYRTNLRLFEACLSELEILRTLLTQAKLLPSITIWKVFIGIIAFLGLLAAILYVVWQRQARTIASTVFDSAKGKSEEIIRPKRFSAKQKREIKAEEIEDIIKKDDTLS